MIALGSCRRRAAGPRRPGPASFDAALAELGRRVDRLAPLLAAAA